MCVEALQRWEHITQRPALQATTTISSQQQVHVERGCIPKRNPPPALLITMVSRHNITTPHTPRDQHARIGHTSGLCQQAPGLFTGLSTDTPATSACATPHVRSPPAKLKQP